MVMRNLLLASLFLLIVNTDTPLETSTWFSREHYSLWIARVGSLSWADLLLVSTILLTMPKLFAAARVREFKQFFGILTLYFFIGGVQNILDGGYLKVY